MCPLLEKRAGVGTRVLYVRSQSPCVSQLGPANLGPGPKYGMSVHPLGAPLTS